MDIAGVYSVTLFHEVAHFGINHLHQEKAVLFRCCTGTHCHATHREKGETTDLILLATDARILRMETEGLFSPHMRSCWTVELATSTMPELKQAAQCKEFRTSTRRRSRGRSIRRSWQRPTRTVCTERCSVSSPVGTGYSTQSMQYEHGITRVLKEWQFLKEKTSLFRLGRLGSMFMKFHGNLCSWI